jgi:hypothetical protein
MDSHNDSDITGLYGRCPHCNWSIKAKSGETNIICGSCKKSVDILAGQFVAPGATSPPPSRNLFDPTRSKLGNNIGVIGCLVFLAMFAVLAFICMSGRRSDNTIETPDYAPVGAGGGSRSSTPEDVRNNPCYVSCATRMSRHPDEIAPQCRNVTPASEYKKCVQGAAASIGELCLKECGLK